MRIKPGKVDETYSAVNACAAARIVGDIPRIPPSSQPEPFCHEVCLKLEQQKGSRILFPAQQLCFWPVHYIPGSLWSHRRAEFMTSGGSSHSVTTRATALALGNFLEVHIPNPFPGVGGPWKVGAAQNFAL